MAILNLLVGIGLLIAIKSRPCDAPCMVFVIEIIFGVAFFTIDIQLGPFRPYWKTKCLRYIGFCVLILLASAALSALSFLRIYAEEPWLKKELQNLGILHKNTQDPELVSCAAVFLLPAVFLLAPVPTMSACVKYMAWLKERDIKWVKVAAIRKWKQDEQEFKRWQDLMEEEYITYKGWSKPCLFSVFYLAWIPFYSLCGACGAIRWWRRKGVGPKCLKRGSWRRKFVLSHGWLSPGHPDPRRKHLKELVLLLENAKADDEDLIFVDYCSVPQKNDDGERTEAESEEFGRCLGGMNMVYTDMSSEVFIMPSVHSATEDPEANENSRRPYDERGWCYFELAVSAAFFTIVNDDSDQEIRNILQQMPVNRPEFRDVFRGKKFTNKGDREKVLQQFDKECFQPRQRSRNRGYIVLSCLLLLVCFWRFQLEASRCPSPSWATLMNPQSS